MKPVHKVFAASVFCSALMVPVTADAFSWTTIIEMIKNQWKEAAAWSVETLQTSVASMQVKNGERDANRALATALSAINETERTVAAISAVHAEIGQPNTIKCIAQRDATMMVEAQAQRERDAARLMHTFSQTRIASQAEAELDRRNLHNEMYCTVGEARMGACTITPNGMQGYDIDYGAAFGPMTLSPEGELAAYAYIARIADVRAPEGIDCTTTACQGAQWEQMRAAALGSMVASALVAQVTDRRSPMLTGQ